MVKDKSTLVSTSGCPARIEVNLITKLSHSRTVPRHDERSTAGLSLRFCLTV